MVYGRKRLFKKKPYKKVYRKKANARISSMLLSNKRMVPEQMFHKFVTRGCVFVPAAGSSAKYFDVNGTSLYQPFVQTYSYDAAGWTKSEGTPASTAILPEGASYFIGADKPYQNYHVYKFSFKITAVTKSTSDPLTIVLVPWKIVDAADTVNASVFTGAMAPYSKSIDLIGNGKATLSGTYDARKMLSIKNDLSVTARYTTTPAANLFVRFIYNVMDDTAPTGNIIFKFELVQHCRLFNPSIGGVPE